MTPYCLRHVYSATHMAINAEKVTVSCQNLKYYLKSSGSTDRNASATGVNCQTLCRQLTLPGCEPATAQNGLEKLSLIS